MTTRADAGTIQTQVDKILGALEEFDLISALKQVQSLAESRPESALAYHLAGLASLRADEVGKGLEAFATAQRLAPEVADHSEAIAIVHARMGNVVDALFNHKLALAGTVAPEAAGLIPAWMGTFNQHFFEMDDQPLLRGGEAALLAGELSFAERNFRQATEVDPKSLRGLRGLAKTLTLLGRAHESIATLIRARDAGATSTRQGLRALWA